MSLRFATALVAVLVALQSQGARAIAPGDEDSRCQTGIFSHSYAEGVIPLMDTHNYERLLGVNNAVWHEVDFDNNNMQDSFRSKTKWQQSTGGVCRWTIQSCGYRQGQQDNWVITQYIEKSTPLDSNITVEVCVNLTFTITNCRQRFGCTPTMEIYRYDAHSEESTSDLDEKLESDLEDRRHFRRVYRHTRSSTLSFRDKFCFNMNTNDEGFYLAIRDRTSCILLSNMLVYRHECAGKRVGLVYFPRTASASTRTRTIEAQCIENAEPSSSLLVHCRRDGTWTDVTPACQCKPGYVEITNEEDIKHCIACAAGTYRSSSDPVDTCIPCPDNTEHKEGVAECQCLTGYFRNRAGLTQQCPSPQSREGSDVGCTKSPTSPTNVRLTSDPTSNTLSLRWNPPSSDGNRSDLYYCVEYSDPDHVGEYINPTSDICLTRTEYDITGLQPATPYLVHVSAHNGVSDEDPDGILSRIAEFRATTANAPPSSPVAVEALCNVIVWRKPERQNGIIISYDLMFFHLSNPQGAILRTLVGDTTYFLVTANDLPSGSDTVYVKVRAANAAGAGIFSAAVPNDCSDGNAPPQCPTNIHVPATPTTAPPTSRPGSVTEIEVLGCGVLAWKPPSDTGNEDPGYAVKFYDSNANYEEVHRFFDDPSIRWAKARSLPRNIRPIYADVQAGNSAGYSSYSQRVVVANTNLCDEEITSPPPTATTEPPSPTSQPTCPTTEAPTCPAAPACDSCCASCPDIPSCPTSPSITEAEEDRISPPGIVRNVRAYNCTTIMWDAPEDDGGEVPQYRVRIYSGRNFYDTPPSERTVIATLNHWVTVDRFPSRRIMAIVKGRNSAGFSPSWSYPVVLTDTCSS